jgi:hypothetical protein
LQAAIFKLIQFGLLIVNLSNTFLIASIFIPVQLLVFSKYKVLLKDIPSWDTILDEIHHFMSKWELFWLYPYIVYQGSINGKFVSVIH